ncbi:phosphatase PAP2 family protein [Patescibacteria group bacterium]|nr:phosphatase PAP2 family protein [Patescibacteria group bacterium]
MKRYLPHSAFGFATVFILLAALITLFPVTLSVVDTFVHTLAIPLQTPGWSNVFVVITTFGSTEAVIAVFLVIAYLYRHRPDIIARLLLALLGATISGEYIKELLHRARPTTLAGLQAIHSYSFPSGHSNESMVLYGFLGVLLFIHAKSRPAKIAAIIVPTLIILLVGVSRIVLNYHYLTDVLGGFMLGAFWLAVSFAIPLYRTLYHYDTVSHTEPITRPLV